MFDDSDTQMQQAYQAAQASFRYFWRELSWERRRIVPALDMTIVKLPFTDGPRTDGKAKFEQMWIEDIGFDGDSVSGNLLNSPNWLKSVRKGERVSRPFSHLTDWMITADSHAYGGFTINLMRSRMGQKERAHHDQAWGLDFGDPANIRVEIQREPNARTVTDQSSSGPQPHAVSKPFNDHPACANMVPRIQARLQADPAIARTVDDHGWSILHHEALAGNLGVVKLLITFGADAAARTPNGYTAADLARKIGWSEIAEVIPP